jgi:hypothetical protein
VQKKYFVLLAVIGLSVLFAGALVSAQEVEGSSLLIVDETESMETSMRIQGFVAALKRRSNIEVITRMAKPENPTDNPVEDSKNLTVDAIIIFPRTIETGRINQVWIATRPYSAVPPEMRPEMITMMEQLKGGIEQAFSGKVRAVDVNDDVIPAYFSTLFLREGVLR